MDLSFNNVSYAYPLRDGKVKQALTGVSLTVRKGECLGIIGPEGAGKTTLLLVMDMLLVPDEGSVLADGVNVWEKKEIAVRERRRIGMGFQFPEQQFVAETVEEELLFPASARNSLPPILPADALSAVGLDPKRFLKRYPFHLSMGEARRVALASLLVRSPEVLLLDEPTVGLDGEGKEEFLRFIKAQHNQGTTLVMVSHDLDCLCEVATNIVVLREGCVEGAGSVASVMRDAGLLNLAGYDQPETITILDHLASKGIIATDVFLRPDEIARLRTDGFS
jgi:energy-coupling factor transport system ATP-binding protein